MTQRIKACAHDDVAQKVVLRLDHVGLTFVIYRSPPNKYYSTDGLCTHERVVGADGLSCHTDKPEKVL